MFTRYAYFMGQPRAGAQQAFLDGMRSATASYASLPQVRGACLELPLTADDSADAIYAQISMQFDSEADIEAMLASPGRHAVRAMMVDQVMPLFDGTVVHANMRAVAL